MRALYLLFFIPAWLFASIQVSDDLGSKLSVAQAPKRIISLAPDLTEILFAIGAQDKIVGAVNSCDYPAAAKKITKIGAYNALDVERMLTLQPDLIITWGKSFAMQLAPLRKINIPIYISEPHTLTDVARTMRTLGILLGVAANANAAADAYMQRWQQLKNNYQSRQKVRVFYQLGSYSLMTINKKSWINEAIELCGGENIFKDTIGNAPIVDMESIVAANPEVILSDGDQKDGLKQWLRWKSITASAQQHVYRVSADLIDRAGPRLLDGTRQICLAIDKVRKRQQ